MKRLGSSLCTRSLPESESLHYDLDDKCHSLPVNLFK